LVGCTSSVDDAEASAYEAIEGIYEVTGVSRYEDACDASGEPSTPSDAYVYSRVSGSLVDGVGVTELGVIDDACQLVLEESWIERDESETRFVARERWGAAFSPEADGSCAVRDDLSSQWRDWQDHPCRRFEVIRSRRSAAL
jgi:hypothetical protein